jgi:hypothetical protein
LDVLDRRFFSPPLELLLPGGCWDERYCGVDRSRVDDGGKKEGIQLEIREGREVDVGAM